MDKKSILFVKDKDSPFELKMDFLDKTRYVLEVISGYEEALNAIKEKDFNLIICALKEAKLQLNLFNEAKKKNFWIKTVPIITYALEDFLDKVIDRSFSFNIVGGNPPLNLKELSITVEKLFTKDIFGIERYLTDKAKSVGLLINDSNEKINAISQIVDFVRKYNKEPKLLGAVSDITDELLMNALYDAPCNEKGEHIYAHIDRMERVVLDKEKAISLKCAYDGNYLIVSATDHFGSLDRDEFVNRQISRITKTEEHVRIKPGGGGIGVYKILAYLSAFIVNLQPRRKTEVICIIDLKWPAKDFQKKFKSFHIFTSGTEIKIADELIVTREDIDDTLEVAFNGVIDERAYLGRVFQTDRQRIKINIQRVRRINSCGVREWVNAVREIPPQIKIEFVASSISMVRQFNMIANFGGRGRHISFMAPYYCANCNKRFERVVMISEHLEKLRDLESPAFTCQDCGGKLEFDDLEDKYFQFIARQQSAPQFEV